MKKPLFLFLSFFAIATLFTSCVTRMKYDELLTQKNKLEADKAQCDEDLLDAKTEIEQLTDKVNDLNGVVSNLKDDTLQVGIAYRKIKGLYGEVNSSYERLMTNYNRLLSNSAAEAGRLGQQLSDRERELLALEKNLNELSATLATKEANINQLNEDVKTREQRVKELERVLAEKEAAVNKLKSQVNKALLGFNESDLSVEVKNGKVYVSLADQLLFKSGKYTLEAGRGKDAIKKLSEVLKTSPDINVMVEGHTDDVPMAGGNNCLGTNWDLSVLRATSIVEQLIDEGVPGNRLTASGRSQFAPVAEGTTSQARKQNRRTEIILTPKLDELFQILESN